MPDMLINYTGNSMYPALKIGDILNVLPFKSCSSICKGDIIVYFHPGNHCRIVHRVISIDSYGIRTRGDNNNEKDPYILRAEKIIGLVLSIQRKNKSLKIYGGMKGIGYVCLIKLRKTLTSRFIKILGPIYRKLAESTILKIMIPRRLLSPKIIFFKRPGGQMIQIFVGTWLIGRLEPSSNQWRIKPPFRLFIDEKTLPHKVMQD